MSHRLLLVGFAIVIAVFSVGSLMAGRVMVPFSAWLSLDDPRWAIIFELRMPRTILAVAIGAALQG